MQMLRILVTGAGGFVGASLIPRLLARGHKVSVLCRDPAGLAGLPWYGQVTVFQGDITRPEELSDCCRGQEAVIHCAGHAHASGGGAIHWNINYRGTENLLTCAINAGVGRFVYLSSSKAAGGDSAASPYAAAKRAAERQVLAAHAAGRIRACCLRPSAVYGPGMKGNLAGWIRMIEKGLAPPLPPVDTRIAMIGAEDLAEAITLALDADAVWGNTFTLSDGVPYNIKAIETALRTHLGKKPARFHLPRPLFRLTALGGEKAGDWLGIKTGFGLNGYNTLFRDEYAEDNSFQAATGFTPRQNFFAELPRILSRKHHGKQRGK